LEVLSEKQMPKESGGETNKENGDVRMKEGGGLAKGKSEGSHLVVVRGKKARRKNALKKGGVHAGELH